MVLPEHYVLVLLAAEATPSRYQHGLANTVLLL